MTEQMLYIMKASTKSHCTYITAHCPSAQPPHFFHFPSTPVLSNASEHYLEILPRYCLAEGEILVSIIPLEVIQIC